VPAAAARFDAKTFRRWKHGLTHEMARLTRELHRRRRFHKDLYLCHFYIHEADTESEPAWWGRVRLIDLHRLGHHPWTWPWWTMKDLAQLLYSSEVSGVDVRDRLRFWRAYFGRGWRSWAGQWLRWGVRIQAWTYRRHSRARRKAKAKA
jgi:heptose I phosphotransferase